MLDRIPTSDRLTLIERRLARIEAYIQTQVEARHQQLNPSGATESKEVISTHDIMEWVQTGQVIDDDTKALQATADVEEAS